MKKKIFTLLLLFPAIALFGQARTNINNNAFINISGGARWVQDNPNPNAFMVSGTGGNIITEAENNQIWWITGTVTGAYTLPLTTPTSVKIPFTFTKSTAGNAGEVTKVSTWETTDGADLNFPRPSIVGSMGEAFVIGSPENSLNVIDRFWMLDIDTYGSTPAVDLDFGYEDAANAIGGNNTIIESGLRAQRWNPLGGGWQGLLFGSVAAGTNIATVPGAYAAAGTRFKFWTLTNALRPLPITLVSMNADAETCTNTIRWTVSSEENVQSYTIQRSEDGINWSDFQTVNALGLKANHEYIVRDVNFTKNGELYYRILVNENTGQVSELNPMAILAFCDNLSGAVLYPNPFTTNLTVGTSDDATMSIFDATGRILITMDLEKGKNDVSIENLAIGTYTFQIIDVKGVRTVERLIKR